jgi:hypothetical protein
VAQSAMSREASIQLAAAKLEHLAGKTVILQPGSVSNP